MSVVVSSALGLSIGCLGYRDVVGGNWDFTMGQTIGAWAMVGAVYLHEWMVA